jgi:hypothetical protein
MVSRQRQKVENPRSRPATTPEGRENQITSLAYDLAEKQLRDGTASSQLIAHFLKQGSPRETLERDRLAKENELLKAKVKQLESAERVEELYKSALNAMRTYAGQDVEEDEYDYD